MAAVQSHLYSMADTQEAYSYVSGLVYDYYWDAKYRPGLYCGEDEECWHVEYIVGSPSGASWAHWYIYGSEMSVIVPSAGDPDAVKIEACIKELNVNPDAYWFGID